MVQIRTSSFHFKDKSASYNLEEPSAERKDEVETGDMEQYRIRPQLEYYRIETPAKLPTPFREFEVVAACPATNQSTGYRSRDKDKEEERKLRYIDLRLAQKYSVPSRLKQEKTRVCRGDFPDGILPRSLLSINLEKLAKRESLNYSTTQRRLGEEGCSIKYILPLRIYGKVFPIFPRVFERPRSGWMPKPKHDRAQSAPPFPRQTSGFFHGGITGDVHSTSTSRTDVSTVRSEPTLQPNYTCECFIQDQPEPADTDEEDADRLSLQKYIKSIGQIKDTGNIELLARHFKTYIPPRSLTDSEIIQLHELLAEKEEFKMMGVFIILERLASKTELCEILTAEFFVPLMRIWIDLIGAPDCIGAVLDPIVGFTQKVTSTTPSEKWLDYVYKEKIIEATTGRMTCDGTHAHYCTLMLRVFSDSRCCANMLANTALPECISLPQVKQGYWDEQDRVFLDEDIFLQEEILKIFCNIAQSSSFGRKILICHGVIDTISRILAYANCPVQYQAALLVGALCEDNTGCDHVTSELTNQRADNATCMRHLGNLFSHSQCMRVKAAAGSAMSRMFCTSDRKIANRGLRMVHDVLFSKSTSGFKRPERPKTAPATPSMEKTVNIGIVKDVMYKYADLCTTKGPFSHDNFFRCRLMALEACKSLLSFPLKKDGKRSFHLELGKVFFTTCGEELFRDLKNIADKHRYVKVLQEKIQKIQINLISKTKRNERLSELLNVELQDIKNDNSVIRIPKRDFELAKNELIYCEIAIKSLSTVLGQATDSLNIPIQDNSDLLESMRRYNSQYTTLQDSLYNKYAMSSVLQNPDPKPKAAPAAAAAPDNGEVHLKFVTRLFTHHIVETLVPWLYCVYPPITQNVMRSLSCLFVYSSCRSMTVHCLESPETERWIQPSDVARYFNSTVLTPRHISAHQRTVQLTDSIPVDAAPATDFSADKIIVIPNFVKPEVIVEQCTHHIGHLCSKLLTQKLLICNHNTVSHLAAQLLRDITRTVPRDHLMCMLDENLLEKLTEYIILCHGHETSVFVALDILQTLLIFQPTLGKLYHSDGGLDRLVAKLLSASTPTLKARVLEVINIFPNDERWCRLNKVDCETRCQHMDVWHKVISKWENQDNVSRLLSVE